MNYMSKTRLLLACCLGTGSALTDYTRTKNDTTFYLQSRSRRSPLPESLRMEQTPTAEITE